MPPEPPTAMPDVTTNPEWEGEQVDRFLGHEILRRTMEANYHPVNPAELAELAGFDKGYPTRIIEAIRESYAGR